MRWREFLVFRIVEAESSGGKYQYRLPTIHYILRNSNSRNNRILTFQHMLPNCVGDSKITEIQLTVTALFHHRKATIQHIVERQDWISKILPTRSWACGSNNQAESQQSNAFSSLQNQRPNLTCQSNKNKKRLSKIAVMKCQRTKKRMIPCCFSTIQHKRLRMCINQNGVKQGRCKRTTTYKRLTNQSNNSFSTEQQNWFLWEAARWNEVSWKVRQYEGKWSRYLPFPWLGAGEPGQTD